MHLTKLPFIDQLLWPQWILCTSESGGVGGGAICLGFRPSSCSITMIVCVRVSYENEPGFLTASAHEERRTAIRDDWFRWGILYSLAYCGNATQANRTGSSLLAVPRLSTPSPLPLLPPLALRVLFSLFPDRARAHGTRMLIMIMCKMEIEINIMAVHALCAISGLLHR